MKNLLKWLFSLKIDDKNGLFMLKEKNSMAFELVKKLNNEQIAGKESYY